MSAAAPEALNPEVNKSPFKNAKVQFGTSADGVIANGQMQLSYVERRFDKSKGDKGEIVSYKPQEKENHAKKLVDSYTRLKEKVQQKNPDLKLSDLKKEDVLENIPKRVNELVGPTYGGVFASVTGGNGELSGLLTTVIADYISSDENKGKPIEEVLKGAHDLAMKFKEEFNAEEREKNSEQIKELEKKDRRTNDEETRLAKLKGGSRAEVCLAVADLKGELKVLTTGDNGVVVGQKGSEAKTVTKKRDEDVSVQTVQGLKKGDKVVLCKQNKVGDIAQGMKNGDNLDTLLQKATTPGTDRKGNPEKFTNAASGGSDEAESAYPPKQESSKPGDLKDLRERIGTQVVITDAPNGKREKIADYIKGDEYTFIRPKVDKILQSPDVSKFVPRNTNESDADYHLRVFSQLESELRNPAEAWRKPESLYSVFMRNEDIAQTEAGKPKIEPENLLTVIEASRKQIELQRYKPGQGQSREELKANYATARPLEVATQVTDRAGRKVVDGDSFMNIFIDAKDNPAETGKKSNEARADVAAFVLLEDYMADTDITALTGMLESRGTDAEAQTYNTTLRKILGELKGNENKPITYRQLTQALHDRIIPPKKDGTGQTREERQLLRTILANTRSTFYTQLNEALQLNSSFSGEKVNPFVQDLINRINTIPATQEGMTMLVNRYIDNNGDLVKNIVKAQKITDQQARDALQAKVNILINDKDPHGSLFFTFARKGLDYFDRMVKTPVIVEKKPDDTIITEKRRIEGPQATRQTLEDIAGKEPQQKKEDETVPPSQKGQERTGDQGQQPQQKKNTSVPQQETPQDQPEKPQAAKQAPHTGGGSGETVAAESGHDVPPGMKPAPTAEGEKRTEGNPPQPEAAPAPGKAERDKGKPTENPPPGAKPKEGEDDKKPDETPTPPPELLSEIEYVGAAFNEWGPATENLDLMKHLRSDAKKEPRPKGFWGAITFPMRHPIKFVRQSWQDSIWKSAFDQQALRFASEVRAIGKSHAFNDQSLPLNVDAAMLDKALEEGKKLRDMQPWWRKGVNWARDRVVDVTGFAMNSQQKYATEWLRANGADLAKAQAAASLAEQNALGEKFAYSNNGRDGRLTAVDVQFANSQQLISEKLGERRMLYEGEQQANFTNDVKAIIQRYHDGDIKGNDVALAKAMNEYMYKFVQTLSPQEREQYVKANGLELATNIISLAKKIDKKWDEYQQPGKTEGKTRFEELQIGLLMGRSEFSQARGRRAENNILLEPNHMLAGRLAEKKMMMDGKANKIAEGVWSAVYNSGVPAYDFLKDAVAYGGAYAVGSAASVANFGKNKAIGALTLPMGPIGGALGVSAMAGLKESGVVISHNGKLYGVGGRVLSEMAQANKDVALGLTSDGEIRKKYESVFVDARSYSEMLNGVDALLSKKDLTPDEAKRLMTFAAEVQARQRLTDASTEPGFGRVSLPQNFIKYEAGKDNQQAAILRQRAMDATIKLLADPKYTDMIGDPYTGKFADLTKFMEAQLSVGSDKERVADWLVNNAKVPRVNATAYAENLFNTYGSMNIDKQKSLEISMAAAAKMNAWEGVKKAGQTALMAPVLGAVYGTYFGEAFNLGHDILRQDFAHKGIVEGLSQGVGEYFQDWNKVLMGDIPLEVNPQGQLEADLSVLQKGALFGRNVWEHPFDIFGKHDQVINGVNLRLDGGLRYVDDHQGHEALVDIRTGKVTLDMSQMNFKTMDTDGDGQAELVLTDARTGGLLDQQKIFADAHLPPPTLASVNVIHNQINVPGGVQAVDILSPHMSSHTITIEGHATAIPDGTEWREMAGPPHGHYNLVVTGDPNRVLASDVHWDAQGHMQYDKAHSMLGNVNLQEASNTIHGTRIDYGTRIDTQHVTVFGPNGEVDQGEWSKHVDPVTGRQWYGNDTPGVTAKESEAHVYNRKIGDDKVEWWIGDMTNAHQHGLTPAEVNVNRLIELQAHGQLPPGESVGIYFSQEGHINQGILIPFDENGHVVLDPHSLNSDIAIESKMILNPEGMKTFIHNSEWTGHRDAFNPDYMEVVHRIPDGHGGYRLEIFATAKGDGTMPQTIDIPRIVEDPKIVETSQHISILTVNITEPITRMSETTPSLTDETGGGSIFELHSPPWTFNLPILPIPHRNPIEQYTYKTTQETANAVQDPTNKTSPSPVVILPYDGEKKKKLEGQRTALEAKQKELKDKLEAEKDEAKKTALQKEIDEVNKQLAEADLKIYLGEDLDAMTNAEKQAALNASINDQKLVQDKIKGQKERLGRLQKEGKGGSDEAKGLETEIILWEEKLRRITYRVEALEKSLQAVKVEGPKPIEPKPEVDVETPYTVDTLRARRTLLEYKVEQLARNKQKAKGNTDAEAVIQQLIDINMQEINAIDKETEKLTSPIDLRKDEQQKQTYFDNKRTNLEKFKMVLREAKNDPQLAEEIRRRTGESTLPQTEEDISKYARQFFAEVYAYEVLYNEKKIDREGQDQKVIEVDKNRVFALERLVLNSSEAVRLELYSAQERAAMKKITRILGVDPQQEKAPAILVQLEKDIFMKYDQTSGTAEDKLKEATSVVLAFSQNKMGPDKTITAEEAQAYVTAFLRTREIALRSLVEEVYERITRWDAEEGRSKVSVEIKQRIKSEVMAMQDHFADMRNKHELTKVTYYPTGDKFMWQEVLFGPEREKASDNSYRGYLMVEPGKMTETLKKLEKIGIERQKQDKTTNFKWVTMTHPEDLETDEWVKVVMDKNNVGDYSHLAPEDPRIAIYGDSSDEVQEILQAVIDTGWDDIEQDRISAYGTDKNNAPRRPGTSEFQDSSGKTWRSINWNKDLDADKARPGYSEEEAEDPRWRERKLGGPTTPLQQAA